MPLCLFSTWPLVLKHKNFILSMIFEILKKMYFPNTKLDYDIKYHFHFPTKHFPMLRFWQCYWSGATATLHQGRALGYGIVQSRCVSAREGRVTKEWEPRKEGKGSRGWKNPSPKISFAWEFQQELLLDTSIEC